MSEEEEGTLSEEEEETVAAEALESEGAPAVARDALTSFVSITQPFSIWILVRWTFFENLFFVNFRNSNCFIENLRQLRRVVGL